MSRLGRPSQKNEDIELKDISARPDAKVDQGLDASQDVSADPVQTDSEQQGAWVQEAIELFNTNFTDFTVTQIKCEESDTPTPLVASWRQKQALPETADDSSQVVLNGAPLGKNKKEVYSFNSGNGEKREVSVEQINGKTVLTCSKDRAGITAALTLAKTKHKCTEMKIPYYATPEVKNLYKEIGGKLGLTISTYNPAEVFATTPKNTPPAKPLDPAPGSGSSLTAENKSPSPPSS